MYSVMSASSEIQGRTHEVYGSARMGMPQMASMFLADTNEELHTGFEDSVVTTSNWTLNEKFDSDVLFRVQDPNSNQTPQLSFMKGKFKYNKIMTKVKTRFPNRSDKPADVDSMALPELSKGWDYAAMIGAAGNAGYIGNPQAEIIYAEIGKKPVNWSQVKEGMSRVIDGWARAGLSNRKDLSQCRLLMGYGVYEYLSQEEDINGKSLLDKFNETYADKLKLKWDLAPEHLKDVMTSKLVGVLSPLVKFHHGILPSVYNNFENSEDDYRGSNYASQSTGVEVEQRGALVEYDFDAQA